MLYTDLIECKKIFEIDPANPAEDGKLLFFIEQASDIIGTFLDRPGIEYKQRTEIYQGTGATTINLKSRPVFPLDNGGIQVFVDEYALFGSASGAFDPGTTMLTYGKDYCLKIDRDDGGSRSGILYRVGDYWPRRACRQRGLLSPFMGVDTGSVKVVYTGGYTCDTLPAGLRAACNFLVAKMRSIMPTGMEVGSESYQDRSMSFVTSRQDYLLGLVRPRLIPYRNWSW